MWDKVVLQTMTSELFARTLLIREVELHLALKRGTERWKQYTSRHFYLLVFLLCTRHLHRYYIYTRGYENHQGKNVAFGEAQRCDKPIS